MDGIPMNIGEVARVSGVSAKMIRHYEAIGLVPRARRSGSGYRTYAGNDVHTLRFIRHARGLGFSIKQIEALLSLWRDQRRPSSKVKALALAHIEELEARILEMQAMKRTLQQLAAHCHGDERPDCPILDGLASGANASSPHAVAGHPMSHDHARTSTKPRRH